MIRYRSSLVLGMLAALSAPLAAQGSDNSAPLVEQPAEQQPVAAVSVLRYGRFAVAEGEAGMPAATFAAQMQYLKAQGLHPISLQQFVDWKQGRGSLPGNSVLITLDEADQATYSVAFPVLREHGFPFVVFVDGRSFQCGSGVLGVAALTEMQQYGAALGSGSATRPLPCDWEFAEQSGPDAALKMAERELGWQAQRITSAFGSCVAFAFPRGYANSGMLENLAIYGYQVAFGLRAGKVQQDEPSFSLERNTVTDMPSFARAVNFDPAASDADVLQHIRAVVDGRHPVSTPVEMEAPERAALAFPSILGNPAADSAEQPPLPAAIEPVSDQLRQANQTTEAPIPAPQVQSVNLPEMKDPVLTPRPVCSGPAAGTLVRLNPGADWTTRDFPQPVVPQSQTRVAVLGYHNFSNTKPVSDMLLRTSEFCQQMQYIQDAGLTVITMQDFLDWMSGARCLPERCVLITIDDGWRSVYTDAFPVLKAYGYPFTLFLYTSYISGKGFSMTPEMIQEMLESGATVGSHSATHLYPSQWKRFDEASPEYAAQLQQELPDSVVQLKSLFGNCSTYCYPGGYYTEPMLRALQEQGVSAAFTVLEKKVTSEENPLQVHRYMVFGSDPRIFRRAVNFDDVPGIKPTAQGITEARDRARRFFPQAFETASSAPAQEAVIPAPQQPIPAQQEKQAPKAQLDEIPAPVYTNPQA